MKATLPFGQRHWRNIPVANRADWDYDSSAYWLSKTACRILRHKDQVREADGAVAWEKLCLEYSRAESTVDISDWTRDEWIEHLARGSNKQRFQHCLDSTGNLLYLRAIQSHSGRQKVDPTLQDNVMLPNNFVKYIYHVGCSHDLHSIIQSGLIAGGKDARKGRQTVFFTVVDPMHEHLTKEQYYDVTQPRVVPYKSKWKVHQSGVYWVNLPVAQKKGLTFYQTQSNAIILHDSVPADCIERVVNMKSKEILYESAYFSSRPPPKIVPKTAWQVRHEDHQHADERNSDVEHGDTRSQNDIWQDRREEHQQADSNKFIVECGATCAEGETETHLWETRREIIKKHMKTHLTSSTGKPVADTRICTLKWVTEFKEYTTQQSTKKTMLEDN